MALQLGVPILLTCVAVSRRVDCVPLATSQASASQSGGLSAAAIAGIAVAAVASLLLLLLLLLLIGVLLCWRGHTKEAARGAAVVHNDGIDIEVQMKPEGLAGSVASSQCTEYSLEEVLTATSNWASDNQLRSGAFGDVYKGVSPRDGTNLWAVKRAKLLDADFQREVRHMADKNHPNVVRLLGFAIGGGIKTQPEHVLIYEFVSNGSLDKWIKTEAPFHLSLKQQLDILIGAAHGLAYLHSFGLVHRDIKPANILLTQNMQAKVAEFGLVTAEEGMSTGTTRVMGTPGYVDPIYTQRSKATRASDVYSFGVLMLVVLTGRRPLSIVDGESVHILTWVEDCLSSGTPDRLKELLMSMDAPDNAVLRLAQLALTCTVQRTASRPTMAEISNELQGIRDEVVGKVELSAAVKVDALVQEMRRASPMDAHLNEINELLHGDCFDDQ